MNILITGGTGLLGHHLQRFAPPGITITAIHDPAEQVAGSTHPSDKGNTGGFGANDRQTQSIPLNITDQPALKALFAQTNPDVVIHTAAQGNLDWCEKNPSATRAINVTGSQNVANSAHDHGAHFIFISSNAVYDGAKGNYTEEDTPHPLNVYSQTKVAIEQWLATTDITHTIIRPNLMYGWPTLDGRDNQVSRVITALRNHQPVNAVIDTYFTPLAVHAAAQAIWKIAANHTAGTFNLGGADRLSLFELSQQTAQTFNLDPTLISPISVTDSPAIARRPIDTSFDTTKIHQELSIKPLTAKQGLQWMKHHEPANIPV